MISPLHQQQSLLPSKFAHSSSFVQGVAYLSQGKDKIKSDQGKQNWFQSRFGKEHRFGSGIMLVNLTSSLLQVYAAKKEKDGFRMTTGTLASALTTWGILSSRGGKMPEGDAVLERVAYTVKHPDSSAVHFAMLGSIGITAIAAAGHLRKGFSNDPTERIRITSGELGLLSVGMMTIGLFKDRKNHKTPDILQEITQEPENGGILAHARKLYRFAWQFDTRGVVGRYISIGNQLCDLMEGVAKRSVEGKASTPLIASALIDLCVVVGQSLYFYEQLMRAQLKDIEKAGPQDEQQEKTTDAPPSHVARYLHRASDSPTLLQQ